MTDIPRDQKKHVLILDDDDLFLELANAFLKAAGCRISSFSSFETALEFAKHEKLDAVICDVNLRNDKNGVEFLREFQKIHHSEKINFAFTTGDAIKIETVQNLVTNGSIKVFLKPFKFSEVVNFVLTGK